MTLEERLKEKREEILRLAAKHGATHVRLFGSAAAGSTGKGSDIDLLVDTAAKTSPWFPAGLIQDLETLLGCDVDIVTEKALHWYIRDRVLKEAQPL